MAMFCWTRGQRLPSHTTERVCRYPQSSLQTLEAVYCLTWTHQLRTCRYNCQNYTVQSSTAPVSVSVRSENLKVCSTSPICFNGPVQNHPRTVSPSSTVPKTFQVGTGQSNNHTGLCKSRKWKCL